MIALGNTEITNIGDIQRIYHGETLVYEKRLPEGYTRLEWVGSRRTGANPYVALPMYYDKSLGFSVRYRHHYTNNTVYILTGQTGARDGHDLGLYIGRGRTDKFYVHWGEGVYPAAEERPTLAADTWAWASINMYDSRKWTFESEDGTRAEGALDGEIYANSANQTYNNYPLAVLGFNRTSRNIDVSEMQVAVGNKLKAWLIAARRDSDGEPGYYDIVRNRFISAKNNTTYKLTAGPEYIYP
ncbi:MAG: hypothetical protein IJ562_04720 [Prevotella sp.]|nr:hypothetical protein [Prevotella sp.]